MTPAPHDIAPALVDVPTELRTQRLIIRPWHPDDAAALFAGVDGAREELREWLPWVDSNKSVDDARLAIARFVSGWALRTDLPYGVFDHHGNVLGGSGLHRMDWKLRAFEIGYWLGADAVGHGYMTECVAALTLMAFDALEAQRVEVHMDPENLRSRRIPERLGFVHEGTLRASSLAPDGSVRDTDVFALVAGDERPSAERAGHPSWGGRSGL